MIIADKVLAQRPQVLLAIVAPEKSNERTAKMSSVIEHPPAQDNSGEIEGHDELNRWSGRELELWYEEDRELCVGIVAANVC